LLPELLCPDGFGVTEEELVLVVDDVWCVDWVKELDVFVSTVFELVGIVVDTIKSYTLGLEA
jgi:hypothetical protein